MQGLRVTDKKLKLADMPIPNQRPETLVRVIKSGICSTDLEIVRGYAGFEGTIGHEFVGVVEESPDAAHLVGKRVVGEINVGCGSCDLCSAGDSRHCATRTVLGIKGRDGAHAEFLLLPAKNLLEVPPNISDEAAVFVEPLAAAYGITEQVEIGRETSVAVVGDGKLGILCALCLRLVSENVQLIGKHPEKLKIAESADVEGIFVDEADKLNKSFDVVVEASGSESGFATALEIVKPRGKIVLKSTFHGKPVWESWRVVVDEITIIGSRCGRFAPAIELLASKQIKVDDLISEEYELRNGVAAVERAGQKGVMKVLLSMAQ